MRATLDKVFSFSLFVYIFSLSCAIFQPQGGFAQSIPHCTSSNWSVLACSWTRDDFQDPGVEVTISGVSWIHFGMPKSMPFDAGCSTNVSSRTALCTVRVYHNGFSCRKDLSLEFSATSQIGNVKEKLSFRKKEVIMVPPSGIMATAISTNEIEVRWGPPNDNNPVCPWGYFCVQLQYASRPTNAWHTALDEGNHGSRCKMEKRLILKQLTPGTLHDIRVRAKVRSEATFSSWSVNVTVQTLEEAPTGLVRSITQDSQMMAGYPYERIVHLSWKGIDGTSASSTSLGYVIQLPSLGRNWTTNKTSFTIPGLDPFSEYLGWISAFNSAGQGPKTNFQIPDLTSQPQTPIVNYTISPTSITLSISTPDQPNGVIIRHDIRWRDYLTDTWLNVTIPWSASSPIIQQVISPLKPSTSYMVEVKVWNKHGSSMYPERIVTPQKVPVIAPRNFTVDTVPGEPNVVEIVWAHLQEFDDMASGYAVFYCALNGTRLINNKALCEDSKGTISINKDGGSVPDSSPFRVGGLLPYTMYSFRLKPFNQAGYGPTSEAVLVRTLQGAPSPPVDIKVSQVASSSAIDVTWSPPLTTNGVIVHYVISYNAYTIQTSATFVRLQVYGYTDYVIGVSACTRPDSGLACSSVTVKKFRTPIMAPSPPRLQDLLPSGQTKIKVHWDPPLYPNGPIQDYVIIVWPPSTNYPNATVSVVDADVKEDEVGLECGEDFQEEREFQIEIFARTVNEEGEELEGDSDTKDIIMCGVARHVSAMMLIILVGVSFLILSLSLAGLIYCRWFRRSHKYDIYFLDIVNVRKRNRRFQHLCIPKPVKQENEVFDVIQTRTCLDHAEVEPNESMDEKPLDQLTVVDAHYKTPDKILSHSIEYLSKDTNFCNVLPNRLVCSRYTPCDNKDDYDNNNHDDHIYSGGSSGYKSLYEIFSRHLFDQMSPMTKVESREDVVYSAVVVTTGMSTNSHLTRSLPSVTERFLSTSPSPYYSAKCVCEDSWSDMKQDKTCNIASIQLKDNLEKAPLRQNHDEPVYCMLSSGEGDSLGEETAYFE